jgi:imidazolonepropionase-like amidohydrolase
MVSALLNGPTGSFTLASILRRRLAIVGVEEEGAFADLLLVEGNPLETLDVVTDPGRNFLIIMNDGVVFKDSVPK